ncbi:hypothetical protein ACFVRR_06175 [Gottfriedia sp. NPDC057948]|uniref:hypothetical protein n=1 Tax=Gottfriedia sp. NPDC057948 TaxID=3346287 RepID=UPI0036DD6DB9
MKLRLYIGTDATCDIGDPTIRVSSDKITPSTVNKFSAGLTTIGGTIPQGATKVRIYFRTNCSQVLNRGAIAK